MDHYLSNLTFFSVDLITSIDPIDRIWLLSVDGTFAGAMTGHPSETPKAVITNNGFSSIVYGVTIEECLLVASKAYLDMADWDRDADPVDEEAEIDRERHAD